MISTIAGWRKITHRMLDLPSTLTSAISVLRGTGRQHGPSRSYIPTANPNIIRLRLYGLELSMRSQPALNYLSIYNRNRQRINKRQVHNDSFYIIKISAFIIAVHAALLLRLRCKPSSVPKMTPLISLSHTLYTYI